MLIPRNLSPPAEVYTDLLSFTPDYQNLRSFNHTTPELPVFPNRCSTAMSFGAAGKHSDFWAHSSTEDYSGLDLQTWPFHTCRHLLPDLINIMTELSITEKCDDLFPGTLCWKWLHDNRWTLISEWGWLDKLFNMYQLEQPSSVWVFQLNISFIIEENQLQRQKWLFKLDISVLFPSVSALHPHVCFTIQQICLDLRWAWPLLKPGAALMFKRHKG